MESIKGEIGRPRRGHREARAGGARARSTRSLCVANSLFEGVHRGRRLRGQAGVGIGCSVATGSSRLT
ncbi:hypothetical protein GW17_00012026 [Ensete ventricosum]|nr:hypothetical protein GW17_00012026 [Ensete ventricosum]RZR89037.1 hypothetical protein BHM03_00016705 [Ensete ventricosum]